MIELRLRSQISDAELAAKVGKIVTPLDYNVLLTGPTKVLKPNGTPLCVYLPYVLSEFGNKADEFYGLLHSLRVFQTDNRGPASGSERFRYGEDSRTRSMRVRSTIIGSFDPGGPKQFCRLTSWNAQHVERFAMLLPLLQSIDWHFKEFMPARYAKQADVVAKTHPDWVIPRTVFTTVTVNNTYPTGVHTDSGDLEEGFSTLACFRYGDYSGGELVFPRYRVAVNMNCGDLLLMDAHEHHGNVAIEQHSDDAERISVVSYFRSRMPECGSSSDEYGKAVRYAEGRGSGRARSSGEADSEGAGDSGGGTADADEAAEPVASA